MFCFSLQCCLENDFYYLLHTSLISLFWIIESRTSIHYSCNHFVNNHRLLDSHPLNIIVSYIGSPLTPRKQQNIKSYIMPSLFPCPRLCLQLSANVCHKRRFLQIRPSESVQVIVVTLLLKAVCRVAVVRCLNARHRTLPRPPFYSTGIEDMKYCHRLTANDRL